MSDAKQPTLIDREPLTAALFEEWDVIDGLLAGLTDEQWSAPTPLPGWNVHDVVAHLIGVESMLSGIEPPATEDEVPDSPHVHNAIGAYNERWVTGLRSHTHAEVLSGFRDITRARRGTLSAMTQDDFDAPSMTPVGPDTYGRFMRTRLFDCWFHELDIRDAVGLPGEEGGPRAEYSLAELVGGLGFAVGKKGGAPQGGAVTFALTGPLARDIHVAVDGRAAVVPALDGPATATLRLDSRLFTRLCGGRVSAADHSGEITILGDQALGEQIAANLAFTI
ncbi:maleylpyruvate isomerase family mycothiol-dependent enzyme [Rhodococcus sp. NPDC058514]|uniref:maleylpyruvate isomerase family mycothiol-dependent enzyme n=1 Tax=unclassified Rhodococcus (in: high G+C Gram-positive bacteria) TaxID=192944 RepID=UPI0036465C93